MADTPPTTNQLYDRWAAAQAVERAAWAAYIAAEKAEIARIAAKAAHPSNGTGAAA